MKKEIPFKNYIMLAGILIITILLVIYLFNLQSIYHKNKLQSPILDKYLMIINYNELDDYLTENENAVVYISLLKDEKVRTFENKFKNIIVDNNLNNKILYLNLTNEIEDKEKRQLLNTKYGEDMIKVPSIVIFKEKRIVSSFNIKENNYNLKELEKFLKEEDVIDD